MAHPVGCAVSRDGPIIASDMRVYVCLFVGMFVCVRVVCMYVCLRVVYVCMFACCVYVCMYVCLFGLQDHSMAGESPTLNSTEPVVVKQRKVEESSSDSLPDPAEASTMN
eukprot:GHVU01230364.1.p2 GENE.GHVU01230364.1~~GHVU01230364.1.p2  ORF type:complete len:110 (-),score=7.19 GHVU01230364.1:430-759(-)